jgi:hypothetical protein
MREAYDVGLAINEKLRINGIRMARGDAIPHMREAALKRMPGQLGSHFEGADKLAHGAGICEYGTCGHAVSCSRVVNDQ